MKPTRVTEKWREEIEKGMMPERVSKTYIPEVTATEGGDGIRKAAFVVSTGSEDRDGDTVAPEGWMLDNYRKNPVVLWAHDVKSLPIARADSISVQGGKLKSVTVFPDKGVYPFADQVFGLVKGGFLKGTSVGFHPLEATPRRGVKKGVDFRRQELYEFSLLPIPSNREALAEAKAAGHDIELVVKWATEFLDYAEANGLWVPKFQIEKALAQVRNLTVTVPAMPAPEAGVGSEDHAFAGAVLSDDEAKAFLDLVTKEDDEGVLKYIKQKPNGKWCVYSKDGKLLGEHATRAEAVNQLQAVEANKQAEVPDFVAKHLPGQHDQADHAGGGGGGEGRTMDNFTRENRADKESIMRGSAAAQSLKTSGGFSLDKDGQSPTSGYMVSPYKERERVIDGDASASDISIFEKDNADLLDKPGHFLGGWKDSGKTYLDVSLNVPSRAEAHALGLKHGQLEVWNVAESKSEKTEEPKPRGRGDLGRNMMRRGEQSPEQAARSAARGAREVQAYIDRVKPTRENKKGLEADMDIVTKLADDLFGDEAKAAPAWAKEGEVDPQEAAKAAKEAAEMQNDSAKEAADEAAKAPEETPEGEAAGAVPPGGDPTEAEPGLAPILDALATSLMAEIEPLKMGGDPTQIATGLKAALEKFAASFMQTYIVPGSQAVAPGTPPPAAMPAAAPPGAKPAAAPPAAAPAAPAAKPPAPPPQSAAAAPGAPAAKPAAVPPPAAPGAPPAQKPPYPKKGFSMDDLTSLDESEVRATIQKVIRRQMDEARMHLTGRLPG